MDLHVILGERKVPFQTRENRLKHEALGWVQLFFFACVKTALLIIWEQCVLLLDLYFLFLLHMSPLRFRLLTSFFFSFSLFFECIFQSKESLEDAFSKQGQALATILIIFHVWIKLTTFRDILKMHIELIYDRKSKQIIIICFMLIRSAILENLFLTSNGLSDHCF